MVLGPIARWRILCFFLRGTAYSKAHAQFEPKPLSRRLRTAHPAFERMNRHADISSKGGTDHETYKMRKTFFFKQKLSFLFLANIATHFFFKIFLKALCTKMQQVKREEEEMT